MSKKQPNRLATLIDHQAFSGSALPQTLADGVRLLTEITHEVKTLLVDCLPEDVLNSCWVVAISAEQLTLSVDSTTAANHIRYLQSAYLRVLTEQSTTFRELKHIRVIVSSPPSHHGSAKQPFASLSDTQKANKNQALSQNVKQTISQAANHVTTDEKLKEALLRLADQ